jgi:hypothetical protein
VRDYVAGGRKPLLLAEEPHTREHHGPWWRQRLVRVAVLQREGWIRGRSGFAR